MATCAAVIRVDVNFDELMSDNVIEQMVQRFLRWKLPTDFNPDGGIKFDKNYQHEHGPVGTNLLTHEQAKAMVREMIKGIV